MPADKDARKTQGPRSDATAGQDDTPIKPRKIPAACFGCGSAFVIAAIASVIWLTIWDGKDARLYEDKPLPANVGYIGRWISDDTVGVRVDTFVLAGDRLACDFTVRNDSDQDITVDAIGRTVIVQLMSHWLSQSTIPLELTNDDGPMVVTDNKNILGLRTGMPPFNLVEDQDPPAPQPFTLKPGELKRYRYRPVAHQLLMPAAALRLAVQLGDAQPPRPFYFIRKSAGIAGAFEGSAQKVLETTAR